MRGNERTSVFQCAHCTRNPTTGEHTKTCPTQAKASVFHHVRQIEKALWDDGDRAEADRSLHVLHDRLNGLQDTVSEVLRTGGMKDEVWEKLQAALVRSNVGDE